MNIHCIRFTFEFMLSAYNREEQNLFLRICKHIIGNENAHYVLLLDNFAQSQNFSFKINTDNNRDSLTLPMLSLQKHVTQFSLAFDVHKNKSELTCLILLTCNGSLQLPVEYIHEFLFPTLPAGIGNLFIFLFLFKKAYKEKKIWRELCFLQPN